MARRSLRQRRQVKLALITALTVILATAPALTAVAVALIGLGTLPHGGDLRPGTVAGADPTRSDEERADQWFA
jgi:hypothetical protein